MGRTMFDWSRAHRAAARSRAAGVINGPDAAPPPRELPRVGNFASHEPTAFWQFGTTLAVTSGVQILHDCRENLNITAGTVGYTQAVVDAVIRDVQTRLGASTVAPQPTPAARPGAAGAEGLPQVSRGLMQWIVWSTYHAGGLHPVSRPADVQLPANLLLPSMNTDASALAANQPVKFYPGVTGEYYAFNPFTGRDSPADAVGVIRTPTMDVQGNPQRTETTSTYGSKAGWLLGGIAVTALILGGRK